MEIPMENMIKFEYTDKNTKNVNLAETKEGKLCIQLFHRCYMKKQKLLQMQLFSIQKTAKAFFNL